MGVVVVREERMEGGHVARLTIDNAAKLNTLNRVLMVEIVEAITRNGECAIKARECFSSRGSCFLTARGLGSP